MKSFTLWKKTSSINAKAITAVKNYVKLNDNEINKIINEIMKSYV